MERTLVTINEREYQIGRIPVLDQGKVWKRLEPGLENVLEQAPNVRNLMSGDEDTISQAEREQFMIMVFKTVGRAIHQMSDDDFDYVQRHCLKVCYFRHDTGWAPLMVNGNVMLSDLDFSDVLQLCFEVVKENLGGFFSGAQRASRHGKAAVGVS